MALSVDTESSSQDHKAENILLLSWWLQYPDGEDALALFIMAPFLSEEIKQATWEASFKS